MNDEQENLGSLQKIYIWALLFEPLKYFLLSPEAQIGFALTVPKIIQGIFLSLFFLYFITGGNIQIKNKLFSYVNYYIIFIVLIIFSSIASYLKGTYFVDNDVSFSIKISPIFNILISLYYFTFFILLPSIIINSKKALEYFINLSIILISLILIIGYLDIISTYFFKYDLICRHIYEDTCVGVAYRFHSILGEPRDAFVFLTYAMALHSLIVLLNKKVNFSYSYLLLIITTMMLTQSASGLVGIIIGFTIIIFFGNSLKIKNLLYYFTSFFLFYLTIYFFVEYSQRIGLYFEEAKNLFTNLDNYIVTDLIIVQSPDIIPLWTYINYIKNFEFYQVLFGSGSGLSSFIVNDYLGNEIGVNNPRSDLARILISGGMLGLFFYIKFLIHPVKRLVGNIKNKNHTYFLFSSLLLFGCTLGHRSLLGFIFVGIIIAILVNKLYYQNAKED